MTWERSVVREYSHCEQWDTLIGGLRWYRWKPAQGTFYAFEAEDSSLLGQNEDAQYDSTDFKTADDWRRWAFAPSLWSEVLVAEPTLDDGGAIQDKPKSPTPEVAADVTPMEGTRLEDPIVTSVRAPQYAPGGAYAWPVEMSIEQAEPTLSWIIQKVHIEGSSQADITFWEAFPISAGQTKAENQDIYQGNAHKPSGTTKVTGRMQHHVFAGLQPPGMSMNGGGQAAHEQFTSDMRPPFWLDDNGGTQHDLTFKWGAIKTTLTTVPDGGQAVAKDAHWKLDAG